MVTERNGENIHTLFIVCTQCIVMMLPASMFALPRSTYHSVVIQEKKEKQVEVEQLASEPSETVNLVNLLKLVITVEPVTHEKLLAPNKLKRCVERKEDVFRKEWKWWRK